MALIAFCGQAAAQPAQPGWDKEAQEFFVKSCVHGMSSGQIRDFELAKGKPAPPQTVATIERDLAVPCGCIQKKAASKWQFLEFANNQPRLQGELQAIARECMPKK